MDIIAFTFNVFLVRSVKLFLFISSDSYIFNITNICK